VGLIYHKQKQEVLTLQSTNAQVLSARPVFLTTLRLKEEFARLVVLDTKSFQKIAKSLNNVETALLILEKLVTTRTPLPQMDARALARSSQDGHVPQLTLLYALKGEVLVQLQEQIQMKRKYLSCKLSQMQFNGHPS